MKKFIYIAVPIVLVAAAVTGLLLARNDCCGKIGLCDCGPRVQVPYTFEQIHEGYSIRVTAHDGSLTLAVPVEWEYEADKDTGGIRFWVPGREESVVTVAYYENGFGVCGTGLKEKPFTQRIGPSGTAGYYDNGEIWDFVTYGRYYAVTHTCDKAWWNEYGDQLTEILQTLELKMNKEVTQ